MKRREFIALVGELITVLLETRDPQLYRRAYNALDTLLSGEGEMV